MLIKQVDSVDTNHGCFTHMHASVYVMQVKSCAADGRNGLPNPFSLWLSDTNLSVKNNFADVSTECSSRHQGK